MIFLGKSISFIGDYRLILAFVSVNKFEGFLFYYWKYIFNKDLYSCFHFFKKIINF